jgi:hypothetical protein
MKKQTERYQIESKILDSPESKAKRRVSTLVEISADGSIAIGMMEHSFESLESLVDYFRNVAEQIENFINNPEND